MNVKITENSDILKEGWEKCEAITKKFGTSYYFATQFFPKEIRRAIYAVYAFARIPDEFVDTPNLNDKNEAAEKIKQFRAEWLAAMDRGVSENPEMVAIVHTFRKFQIPIADGEAFFKSMLMDAEKFRYQNYAELEEYMYGSAGVIGLMVTRIVGYSSAEAFQYALKLGYAFQLTNFLRDIRQDCEELGRIYMPLDELAQFNLNAEDIKNQFYNRDFVAFMKFQIERNRQIYRDSLPGIRLLHWRGRLAVKISYVLYQAILREIERADYNVFKGRVRTNFRQKVWLSIKTLTGVYE